MKDYDDINSYIAEYPDSTQKLLEQIRQIIKKAAPDATEAISYGIPTFKLKGNLVHFGGYKSHIGFYPGAGPVQLFANELADYNLSKGTIQFPLDNPLPEALITKIVKYRVDQNLQKAEEKSKKK